MPAVSISIEAKPDGWRAQWRVGEDAVGPLIVAEGGEMARITRLSDAFAAMFAEPGRRPFVRPETLHRLGREMHDVWVAPAWGEFEPRLATADRTLVVRTTDPVALNLPWELMELDGGGPLGCDPAWRIFRTPLARLSAAVAGRPGPLRVLFLAAAPTDLAQLDFEREEDAISTVCGRVRDVVLRIVDSGAADELGDLVTEFRPHVVHLSGHGVVGDDGIGRFAFENEQGLRDERDVETLAIDTFRGSSVRCVFLNACQSARAAVAGMAQHLVRAGVPHVLGWSASVADDRATDFATEFYRRLVHGESLAMATAHAREHIRRAGTSRDALQPAQDATFALPQMYAGVVHDDVVDASARREPYEGPRTERYILGDGIKGLKTGYVGRRREGQRLVPALRDGDKTFAVITGIAGAGKSTLATRAANRLEEAGFRIVAVRVEEGADPATQARAATLKLFAALATAFELTGQPGAAALLRNGQTPVEQRFALAAALLNEVRFLVVLDNVEPAMVVETRQIADASFGAGVRALPTGVTRGSRVLVTCRYLPAGVPMELANVLHVPLPDFREHDVVKFLRREPSVEERLTTGELTFELIGRLQAEFGGTPGFLEQVRTLLAHPTLDVDALRDELDGVEPGVLSEQRQAYYDRIVTSRLYAALSAEAQRVASRVALSVLPLPADGVAAAADLDEAGARRCLEGGVEYGLLQRFDAPDGPSLYQPPGLLRAWLTDLERLPAGDATETHRRLAEFWQNAHERDRTDDLRVNVGSALAGCWHHARLGGDIERWRWAALRLSGHLERSGEWPQAYGLLNEIPESQRDGACWHQLGMVELRQGNYAAAREKFGKSLTISQAIGDKAGEAATWHNLASIDLNEGNYAAAREKFAKSLSMKQAIGDKAGEAATWNNLAALDLHEGDYSAARDKFGRALTISQATGDEAAEAATWSNLARIDVCQGNYIAAREKYGTVMSRLQAMGDKAAQASTWHNLASIDVNEGNYLAARVKLGRSLGISQAIGDKAGEAATWHQLASIDLREGNYSASRDESQMSLRIHVAIGKKEGEAAAWHQLGTIDLDQGDYIAAREKLVRSLAIRQGIGDKYGEAATWHQLASIDLNEGNYAAARDKLGKSLSMRQAIGDKDGEAATWQQLATVDLNEGNYAAARVKLDTALKIQQAIGDRAGEAATWHNLASIDAEEGNYAAAREKFAKSLSMKQAIGDKAGEAATWHQLASIDLNEGKYAAAREKFGKSLSIHQVIGDRVGEAAGWHQLASIDIEEGNNAEGRKKLEKALNMLQAIGHRGHEAATWHQLATIDLKESNYAAAREKLGKALSMRQAIGDKAAVAITWHQLASIDLHEGNYPAARDKLGESLSMTQAIGNKSGEAPTWYQLGTTLCRAGDIDIGLTLCGVGWGLARSIGLGDAEPMLAMLLESAQRVGIERAELDRILDGAWAEYERDRGAGLLSKLGLAPANEHEPPG